MLSDMKRHRSILIQTSAKGLTTQQMPSQPYHCQPVFVPHVQHKAFWRLQLGFGLFILSFCIISDGICTPQDCQICLQILEIRRVIWRHRSSYSFLVFVLKVFAAVLQGSLGKLEDQLQSKICRYNCSDSHRCFLWREDVLKELESLREQFLTLRLSCFISTLLLSASTQDPQFYWNSSHSVKIIFYSLRFLLHFLYNLYFGLPPSFLFRCTWEDVGHRLLLQVNHKYIANITGTELNAKSLLHPPKFLAF